MRPGSSARRRALPWREAGRPRLRHDGAGVGRLQAPGLGEAGGGQASWSAKIELINSYYIYNYYKILTINCSVRTTTVLDSLTGICKHVDIDTLLQSAPGCPSGLAMSDFGAHPGRPQGSPGATQSRSDVTAELGSREQGRKNNKPGPGLQFHPALPSRNRSPRT